MQGLSSFVGYIGRNALQNNDLFNLGQINTSELCLVKPEKKERKTKHNRKKQHQKKEVRQ